MNNRFIIIGLLVTLFFSCDDNEDDNNDDCLSYKTAYITSVEAPATGTVNEVVNIEVNFQVTNGCGNFEKFIETTNDNIKTIEVEAKYEGCICTTDIPIRTVTYQFLTQDSGNYELRFKSSDSEYIIVNLSIE